MSSGLMHVGCYNKGGQSVKCKIPSSWSISVPVPEGSSLLVQDSASKKLYPFQYSSHGIHMEPGHIT